MITSPQGVEQVKAFEGFRSLPYLDIAGKWTVGYGHLMIPNDNFVIGQAISMDTATTWLVHDLGVAERCINETKIQLTQNEFDACVSFIYNLGTGAFQRSTLLKFLKMGQMEAAANEFPKWSMAGGVESKGLKLRRLAEQDCFLHGVYKG